MKTYGHKTMCNTVFLFIGCIKVIMWFVLFNRFMIQCDTCEIWYHGSCVGIEEDEADLIEEYKCDLCC